MRHMILKGRLNIPEWPNTAPAAWNCSGLRYRSANLGSRQDQHLPGPSLAFRPSPDCGSSRMAWLTLFLAGLFEVVWAVAMKQSEGFTRPLPTVIMALAMLLSFGLLSWSMRILPLGTAYTVWTGIGAVGTFIVGAALLGEPLGTLRVIAALLIVCGLVLMKLATPV